MERTLSKEEYQKKIVKLLENVCNHNVGLKGISSSYSFTLEDINAIREVYYQIKATPQENS